jgi:hypothetical protein
MRSFPGRFQPVRISGNKRSGENRIYGTEAKSNAVLKSKRPPVLLDMQSGC